jgi:hypothetical protein
MPGSILLTKVGNQTNVEVSISIPMSISGTTGSRITIPAWKILVCVLLAGLFLYNPFLAIGKSSESLSVCHPASHRATVASSELEQRALPSDPTCAPQPDAARLQLLSEELDATVSASQHYVQPEVVLLPQTGFSSSLWFRPPPAV